MAVRAAANPRHQKTSAAILEILNTDKMMEMVLSNNNKPQ